MLIQSNHIKESLEVATQNQIFDELAGIYHSIPESFCSGCTNCCMESVHSSYAEFLNIYQYLNHHPLLKATLLPKLTKYYFLELIQKNSCPFLNEKGKCTIYEVRPLTCRLFGHWQRKDFDENISAIQSENQVTALYFKEKYKLPLPKEVVTYSIKYCDHFKPDRKISKKERLKMSDDLFELEIQFLTKGLLTENLIGTNLITWFIYTMFDQDEASDTRLKIIKEYLNQGESITLSKIS